MKANEFITSDTHFGHANVIRYSNRPFSSVEEMDEKLIARWNAKVPQGGVVYHLGDVALCREDRAAGILKRLNGSIRLVKGNHDKNIRGDLAKRFEWIKDYYETYTDDDVKVVMFHYALLTWNKSHYGSWMLHGHSHGSLRDQGGLRMDVGVDTHPNYEPYSFAEVERFMRTREFVKVDHHDSDRRS